MIETETWGMADVAWWELMCRLCECEAWLYANPIADDGRYWGCEMFLQRNKWTIKDDESV